MGQSSKFDKKVFLEQMKKPLPLTIIFILISFMIFICIPVLIDWFC